MFRILWDPCSGSIKTCFTEITGDVLCVYSVFGSVKFGPVVCVCGATIWRTISQFVAPET